MYFDHTDDYLSSEMYSTLFKDTYRNSWISTFSVILEEVDEIKSVDRY